MGDKKTAEAMSKIVANIISADTALKLALATSEDCGVVFCGNPYYASGHLMHVYKGIYILAEIFGCTLSTTENWSEEISYHTSFSHGGITFFQLSKTEVPE